MAVTSFASRVDRHVGQRLRQRRESLGISQGRLGRHLGLTFSQIQKYEKGSNRIGAGRLYQISDFLGVAPSYFYDGLDADVTPLPDQSRRPGAARPEELRQLTEAFLAIPDQHTRASVLALVRSLTAARGHGGPIAR